MGRGGALNLDIWDLSGSRILRGASLEEKRVRGISPGPSVRFEMFQPSISRLSEAPSPADFPHPTLVASTGSEPGRGLRLTLVAQDRAGHSAPQEVAFYPLWGRGWQPSRGPSKDRSYAIPVP